MIKICSRCGGLYATQQSEMFAGTPCSCVRGTVWEQIAELITYAKTDHPDPYEVIRRAQEITDVWNKKGPTVQHVITTASNGSLLP